MVQPAEAPGFIQPRNAEIIPFRLRPQPLGLPLTEGVAEIVHEGNKRVLPFAYAVFDMNANVSAPLRAAFNLTRGKDGHTLRGAIVGEWRQKS